MQNEARMVDVMDREIDMRRPARVIHPSIFAKKAEIDEALGILGEWLAAEVIKNWPTTEQPQSRADWESKGGPKWK
jgi:hypothetical protein